MVKFLQTEPKPKKQTETLKIAEDFLAQALEGVSEKEAEGTVLLKLAEQGVNIIVDKEGEWHLLEDISQNVLKEIENIPSEKQEEMLFKILKEKYGINIESLDNGEWFINEEFDKTPAEEKIKKLKESGKLSTYAKRASMIGTALGVVVASILIKSKENTLKHGEGTVENKIEKTTENAKAPTTKKNLAIEIPQKQLERFDSTSFESLSENGKIIYKLMQEKNLTPGRSYVITDKATGELYIIDKNNRLIHKSSVITGTDTGDTRDSSKENVSPVGIYIISKNFINPNDKEEYGKLQFSLYGTAMNKEKVSDIGWHQTYDSLHRAPAYTNPNPEERMLSHGCINWPAKEMKEQALPNFEGDGGELFFVLPGKNRNGKVDKFKPELILPDALEMQKEWKEAERKLRKALKIGKVKLSS